MKTLFRFLAIVILFSGLASCNDDDEPTPSSNVTTFKADLKGSNEVPPNSSAAAGTATLIFDNNTKIFYITVTHNIASPTGAHIHVGAAGTAPLNNVVFPFTNLASPIKYTSVALTAAQESDLNANLYYVNVHSASYTGGEIRGQLIKQ